MTRPLQSEISFGDFLARGVGNGALQHDAALEHAYDAMRDGKWKLVSRYPDHWELFDMEADRTELHDLAAADPERVKTMAAMYEEWAGKIGVQPWPMPQTPPREGSGKLEVPPYLEQHP